MKRITCLLVLCGAAFTAGGVATGASGWRVFATGTDSGAYATYATANADVLGAHALAVRTTKAAKVSWFITCQGETPQATAGAVIVADVSHAVKCTLNGSALTSSGGKLTVQLLRG